MKNANESAVVNEFEQKKSEQGLVLSGGTNLKDIKLSQDFASHAGVKKLITTIPVDKPDSQDFFRVRPDSEYEFEARTIKLKSEKEIYLVHHTMVKELDNEVKIQKLRVGITRDKSLFIWPLTLPSADGKSYPWLKSALEACERAKQSWVRIVWNNKSKAYDIIEASADFGEPQWPDLTMKEILNIAFKNKIINSVDHPVLKRLRGEI